MDTLIKDKALMLIGTFIRYGLMAMTGWLIQHKIITEGEGTALTDPTVIAAIATALGTLAIGIYLRFRSRYKTNVALKMPASATHDDLKNVVANSSVGQIMSTKVPSNIAAKMQPKR